MQREHGWINKGVFKKKKHFSEGNLPTVLEWKTQGLTEKKDILSAKARYGEVLKTISRVINFSSA